jgi:hypothetical protein
VEAGAAVLDLKRANMIGIVMSRFKLPSTASVSASPASAVAANIRDIAAALRQDESSEGALSLEDAQASSRVVPVAGG